MDFLCNTIINFAPAAFKHSIVASPIGPEPKTNAVSPVLKFPTLTECSATVIGSTKAACS